MTATATPSSYAFQTCSSNSAPDRRASLVGRTVGDIRRPDLIRTRDRQVSEQIGIDPMAGMSAAERRFAIQGLDSHAAHQRGHLVSANGTALLSQEIA